MIGVQVPEGPVAGSCRILKSSEGAVFGQNVYGKPSCFLVGPY